MSEKLTDFRGQEIKIGDTVCSWIPTSTNCGYFIEGTITETCKRSGYDCVKVAYQSKYGSEKVRVCATFKVVKL